MDSLGRRDGLRVLGIPKELIAGITFARNADVLSQEWCEKVGCVDTTVSPKSGGTDLADVTYSSIQLPS